MAIKNKYVLEFNSKGVKKTKSDVDKLDQSQGKLAKNATKLKAGMAIAGATIVALGGYAIKTAAEFEKLRTRLNTMYGSVNKGTKAFQTFNKIAATTPFAVKSVVEAGASLKAFGMDAEKNIKGVADLAAFMGVDVVEAAQAMGRAFAGGAGAADVLRERGVLELIKSFKGVDDLTKLTLPEFRQALEESITDPSLGIAGATDALSETFEGSYSNMMDAVDRLASKMGDTLLPTAKSVVKGITGFINSMIESEDATQKEINAIKKQQMQLVFLAGTITQVNLPTEERIKKIRAIQREYPDFLKNMKAEDVTNKDIAQSLDDLNEKTQNKVQILIQEKILNKELEKQDKIVEGVIKQYALLNKTSVDWGKKASDTFERVKDKSDWSVQSAMMESWAAKLKLSLPVIIKNKDASMALLKGTAELHQEFKDGRITQDQYNASVKQLIEDSGLLSKRHSTQSDIYSTMITRENDLKESNDSLNKSYTEAAERVEAVTNKIVDLNKEVGGLSEGDAWANFKEVVNESLGDTELPNFLSNVEKIPIVSTKAAEGGLKGFAKFSGKFHNFLKDSNKDMIGFIGGTIDAMGAIGMATAGDDKARLKIQKAMVVGNVAKGIIDIWTSPAPSNPLQTARAVAASAALVAQGASQRKSIDQQIAEIDSVKGEIGQSGNVTFAQYGMNQVVDGATPIIAGEAGAELVQITPLEGANVNGPQGSGSIIISGNVLSREFVREELADEIREAIRQGYDFT